MFYFGADDINNDNDNDKKRANSLSQMIVLVGDWVTMTQGTQQRFPGASPSRTKPQSKQPLTSNPWSFNWGPIAILLVH